MLLALSLLLETNPGFHESLRGADARLAAIGFRLATANAPLCDRLQPATGMVVHGLGQYGGAERERARVAFGFESAVAVEAVVPDSPAARAGVRADDALIAIDGSAVGEASQGIADRDRVLEMLEAGAPDRMIAVSTRRRGATRAVEIRAVPACRVRFELLLGRGLYAGSDGRIVHLGERLLERYDDAEIAVVVAHELAHAILRHRERLDAAGVQRGLLREFGRNGRLFRRTEQDADELGVALLANAGFDPLSAARFWRTRGGEADGGLLRARTHPSSTARASALEVVGRAVAGQVRPVVPAVLASRDQPLD